MTEYIFSKHAIEMMREREILEDWVWRTLNDSENISTGKDGNLHFSKVIAEREYRVLHVVINSTVSPNRVVTVFFDRRLRSKK